MWAQLLGTVLGGMAGQGGQGGGAPGQEARNVDMSSLIGALGQQQPTSGAVGLPQQQSQMHPILPGAYPKLQQMPKPQELDPAVLPPLENGTVGTPPSLDAALAGMGNPMDWETPGVQKQPVAQQGAATGIPNPGGQQGNPGQAQGQAQGIDWGKLMNFTGTASEPNALVRAGVGYNQGGLIGALGYLLTDMSRQANGTSNQGF